MSELYCVFVNVTLSSCGNAAARKRTNLNGVGKLQLARLEWNLMDSDVLIQ